MEYKPTNQNQGETINSPDNVGNLTFPPSKSVFMDREARRASFKDLRYNGTAKLVEAGFYYTGIQCIFSSVARV